MTTDETFLHFLFLENFHKQNNKMVRMTTKLKLIAERRQNCSDIYRRSSSDEMDLNWTKERTQNVPSALVYIVVVTRLCSWPLYERAAPAIVRYITS